MALSEEPLEPTPAGRWLIEITAVVDAWTAFRRHLGVLADEDAVGDLIENLGYLIYDRYVQAHPECKHSEASLHVEDVMQAALAAIEEQFEEARNERAVDNNEKG